jgi:hypothetical protein
VDATRRALVRELSEHGPTLTEGAWEWILAERDAGVLQLLMAARMLRFKDGEWDLVRRAMFENPALFHAICDAAPRCGPRPLAV